MTHRLTLADLRHDEWTTVMTTRVGADGKPVFDYALSRSDVAAARERGWIEFKRVTVGEAIETRARFTERFERPRAREVAA